MDPTQAAWQPQGDSLVTELRLICKADGTMRLEGQGFGEDYPTSTDTIQAFERLVEHGQEKVQQQT